MSHDLEKLLLTPLIFSKNVSLKQIRELASVKYLPSDFEYNLESYSGYFTVNEKYSSNIFFWFFPHELNGEGNGSQKLILWLNGGPGSASMKGAFAEHGPFQINHKGQLERRKFNLTQVASVVYVDNPVGAGFSYTECEEGWARTLDHVNQNLLSFLDQFFVLFAEYQNLDFYISGESFGGKYVPSLAYAIHCRNNEIMSNDNKSKVKINLQGFTIGAPFTDPIHQVEYGEFLHHVGLIDHRQKESFLSQEKLIVQAIQDEKWIDALKLTTDLILNIPDCTFTKFSGSTNHFNFLESFPSPHLKQYVTYIEQDQVRRALHVGNQNFYDYNQRITMDFVDIFFKSELMTLEKLLQHQYKVLIYSSQLDILVPLANLTKLIERLEWLHKPKQLDEIERKIWKIRDRIVGYVRIINNLTYIELLNVGHLAFMDNPECCVDMIDRFINNKEF